MFHPFKQQRQKHLPLPCNKRYNFAFKSGYNTPSAEGHKARGDGEQKELK